MSPGTTGRPPAFVRRHAATESHDPDALVGLACDESYGVRRRAVENPATPRWVVDLLTRAGADPALRGRSGSYDPDLTPFELRRLAECGPWSRELVAAHPATGGDVLAVLAHQPSRRLRLAVATHPSAESETLARLCADVDYEVRATAGQNPGRPEAAITLLRRAGATNDLGSTEPVPELTGPTLPRLAGLGPWGRFLAARHRSCPQALLLGAATDVAWTIRSGALDNPTLDRTHRQRIVGPCTEAELDDLAVLGTKQPNRQALVRLCHHRSREVRLAVARHPCTGPVDLGLLITDDAPEIRRIAGRQPRADQADIDQLVRAGSTADLMGLADPDPSVGAAELTALAQGGPWARQLVVRHPAAPPTTLARLVCDENPRLREWAAVHPNAPKDVIHDIWRAGGASDFQGLAPADPDMAPAALRRIARLGPWGALIVSCHPNAPADLARVTGAEEPPNIQNLSPRQQGRHR